MRCFGNGDERLVQWYQHRIGINDLIGDCIQEASSLPITTRVEINGISHIFEQQETAPNVTNTENRIISKAEIQKAFII